MKNGSATKCEFSKSDKVIVNPGSVGQPRDRNIKASYALLHVVGEARRVEIRRVTYNIGATELDIRRAGLPESIALRLHYGT